MLAFDFVARRAFLGEFARNDDAVAVVFVFERVFALVFYRNGDLRSTSSDA